jgi:methyltransferase (TIGR00027 family)
MSKRRVETATSSTAKWTCLSRAASSLESDVHYRSDDHIAKLLVPGSLSYLLRSTLIRKFFSRVMVPKGIYAYTIARTKYIDAIFRAALAAGIDQVLIFGAGFDTRALRFQAEAGDTRFFELDVPITQKAKLDRYARRGIDIPTNIGFISIDFDRELLAEKLSSAGFQRNRRDLFVLEGLLMYLQPESVDQTFKVIEDFAGQDSLMVFDYVRKSVLRGTGACYGEREIVKSVSKAGEQWHFGIQAGELEIFLKQYGFSVDEHRDARRLERMYFTDASGKRLGRINGSHCLVKAVKP